MSQLYAVGLNLQPWSLHRADTLTHAAALFSLPFRFNRVNYYKSEEKCTNRIYDLNFSHKKINKSHLFLQFNPTRTRVFAIFKRTKNLYLIRKMQSKLIDLSSASVLAVVLVFQALSTRCDRDTGTKTCTHGEVMRKAGGCGAAGLRLSYLTLRSLNAPSTL